MTNGERIRSMTDEELADILPSGDCFCCPIITKSTHPAYGSCKECALAWLKSEEDSNVGNTHQ